MSSRPRIGIVDYGMGNRRSVEKALERVGADVVLSADADALRKAFALVLPGVGAFPQGMENIRARGLDELISERVSAGVPLLGICLGMQLLFARSEELVPTAGLGLIEGDVRRLGAMGQRLPHIGWNEVRFERPSPLFADLPPTGAPFYHVHSYAAHPAHREHVLASAEYGERFATVVARDAVFGVQFHPEKSSGDGLRLLSGFVALAVRGSGSLRTAAQA